MDEGNFLLDLNESLLEIESALEEEKDERYVNIFLLGLPRSGTTLLAQIVFNNMDVMCTNNLIAKFPKVPIVGCLLSKTIIGEIKGHNYLSNYGKTIKPWEPHEFSWFWHDVLNVRTDDLWVGMGTEHNVAWDKLRSKCINMSSILRSAMVHKPLELAGYNLRGFVENFDKALFIYIDRDPTDVAYSLAIARKDRYGNLNTWWGSYPTREQYLLLKDQRFNIQIAGQVMFLSEMYLEKLRLVPKERLIRTSYTALCENPNGLLQEIRRRSRRLGCEIDITSTPTEFKIVPKEKDAALITELEKGFEVVRSWADV